MDALVHLIPEFKRGLVFVFVEQIDPVVQVRVLYLVHVSFVFQKVWTMSIFRSDSQNTEALRLVMRPAVNCMDVRNRSFNP